MSEIDASNLADAMVVDSEVDDTDTVVDEDEDTKKPDESDKDDSESKKADQEPDEDPVKSLRADMEKKIEDFKASAEREKEDLQKEIKRLGYALRKAEKGTKDDDKTEFTDAQLHQMMRENKDDPDVLFQIVKQMTKQAGDSTLKSAEAKAEIKNRRKELEGITEKVFPGALKDDSPVYDGVQQTMTNFGLDDHPYGDVMALGIMTLNNLPSMIENARKDAQKQGLGKAADQKRKAKIKDNSLADKGSKKTSTKLSPEANETASRLSMNKRQKELYAKFLKAGKKSSTVQVDA
jgi:hypothetical protein